jgi:hypothetical protein
LSFVRGGIRIGERDQQEALLLQDPAEVAMPDTFDAVCETVRRVRASNTRPVDHAAISIVPDKSIDANALSDLVLRVGGRRIGRLASLCKKPLSVFPGPYNVTISNRRTRMTLATLLVEPGPREHVRLVVRLDHEASRALSRHRRHMLWIPVLVTAFSLAGGVLAWFLAPALSEVFSNVLAVFDPAGLTKWLGLSAGTRRRVIAVLVGMFYYLVLTKVWTIRARRIAQKLNAEVGPIYSLEMRSKPAPLDP